MKFTIRISLMGLLLCGVMVTGCNKSKTPSKVHGTVTYNGKPVPAGVVTFYPTEGGIYYYHLNEKGEFSGDSLPAGELVVTVDTEGHNPNRKQQTYGPQMGGDQPNNYTKMMKEKGVAPATVGTDKAEYVKIPEKYREKDKTPLKVNLAKGANEIPLEIKDD